MAGIEGFRDGDETHLYFGLVPSLLRLPIVAATDGLDGRWSQLSMVLGLAVAMWASTRLLWRARCDRDGPAEISRGDRVVFALFVVSVGVASPLLYLASRPLVYHEVQLWGAATCLLGLNAVLAWWEEPTGRRLVVASAAALLAVSTRASIGLAVVTAVVLVAALSVRKGKLTVRTLPAVAAAAALPLLAYVAVNQARFAEPVRIPWERQVVSDLSVLNDRRPSRPPTTRCFVPEYVPSALLTYFRPDGVSPEPLFPFVSQPRPTELGGRPDVRHDRTVGVPSRRRARLAPPRARGRGPHRARPCGVARGGSSRWPVP